MVLRAGPESTIGECLRATASLADLSDRDLRDRADRGELVDADGRPVHIDDPARLNSSVYLYRDVPDEVPIPFDLPILYRDDDIVVVDKPHFLATMPRGRHVAESALVRLRRSLGSTTVSPAHRLDRLTAGVLLCTLRPEVRSAYQQLFADRRVHKEYRALAPAPTGPDTSTMTVRNRIVKTAGDLRARVVDGEVNAISEITPLDATDDGTEYRLTPHTGRTHQLRMHMAGLGVGIVGDPLYPDIRPDLAERPDHGDFSAPLRLVAHTLAFVDPLSGQDRRFVSSRSVRDVVGAPDAAGGRSR
ncbi:pseudouridine synthase [Gordonia soli]|uniref:RNA pseudouridylate synthase n=1 Tax=Gordonia soli NBRC 108243 TaxID=1223545 RepID=M0QFT6_9ACTN|nr:pseudouridine synthase [Gordonia soli]GAC67176.1 putative pseudouridine synthase [Gordonia soli NBRC 108243]